MINKLFLNFLALLFHFVPRNKNLWLTGKTSGWEYTNNPPAFFDNSKYFFLYLLNNTDEKVYWLSSSKAEIEKLTSMGLPVVRFPSLKGVYLLLRAKYTFHHYGPDQLNHILQRNAIQIDFWHGTPLKKIRYDVVQKPHPRNNLLLSLLKKGGKEYVASTSKYLSKTILCHAFDVSEDRMLNFGYPRMDVLGLTKSENIEFCRKYSSELLKYIDLAKEYKTVFLYMPTYRDDDDDYFNKADIDYDLLNSRLEEMHAVMFIKLHPLTKGANFEGFKNIVQINNDVDIYPFLVYTDYLITDYSSIYFDYLVLNKEIIFIPYDLDKYTETRKLYFDYNQMTPGIKYKSFGDFIENLDGVAKLDYGVERERVRKILFDDYQYDACERTYKYFIGEDY